MGHQMGRGLMGACDLSEKFCLHCLLWSAEPQRPLAVWRLVGACGGKGGGCKGQGRGAV